MEVVNLGISDLEDRDECIKTLSLGKIKTFLQHFGKVKFVQGEKIDQNFDIKELKCGGNHTLILLSNGLLLGAGNLKELRNDKYTVDDHWVLLNNKIYDIVLSEYDEVDFEEYKVESVSTCWDSSFIALKSIKESGPSLVLSFGQQSKSELGREQSSNKYTILEINKAIDLKLHSCLYTTVLVAKSQNMTDIFGWGFNNKGQLKVIENKADKQIKVPTLLSQYTDSQDIVCRMGKDFVVICDYKNQTIQIKGNSSIVETFSKTNFNLNDIHHVDTMWSSIHFNKENTILGIGNDQLGQLSMNNKTLPKAKFLKCGSEHMIYVSIEEPNVVKSWGWGEHGNCGVFTGDEDKNSQLVFYEPNVIYEAKEDEEIINVYGGCATTFILTV